MNQTGETDTIENLTVFATLTLNDHIYPKPFIQKVYVECETLELSEKNRLNTDYNQLYAERYVLVKQQLNTQLTKEQQTQLNNEIDLYTCKLSEIKKLCDVAVQDFYHNIEFEKNSLTYSLRKEDFTTKSFMKIANDLASSWAYDLIGQSSSSAKLNIELTLSNGEILKSEKSIVKL